MERAELNTIQEGLDKKPKSKKTKGEKNMEKLIQSKEGLDKKPKSKIGKHDFIEEGQVISHGSFHNFTWYDDITNRNYLAIFDGNGELIQAQSSKVDKDPPNPDVEDCELVADDGALLYMSIFRKFRNVSKEEIMRGIEEKRSLIKSDRN